MIATTSIEFWCFDTVTEIIKSMARNQTFRAVEDDQTKRVDEKSVISRFNRRPSRDETADKGERGFDLPGFVVTYLGHTLPKSAGENCSDYGVIRILVQLIDEGDDGDATHAASYLRWMADVRGRIQRKPNSHISPLEDCPLALGNIYFVHVQEMGPPDETDWGFDEQLRMGLKVECFTRVSR